MTALGIDVSSNNPVYDWNAIKSAGYSFAFIKATEGKTYDDPTFQDHAVHGAAAGFALGAYHFARPDNNSPADEVSHFCRIVGSDYKSRFPLPPVLDWERSPNTSNPSAWRWPWAKAFLEGVERVLGVVPAIYFSPSFWTETGSTDPAWKRYWLWLAHYTTKPSPTVPLPWTDYIWWQYTDRGTLNGVRGFVDLNRGKWTGQTAPGAGAVTPATPWVRISSVSTTDGKLHGQRSNDQGRSWETQRDYSTAWPEITWLQKRLNAKGNYGVAEDGIGKWATDFCLRDWQKTHGLTVDGVVGPRTRQSLE